MDLDEYVAGNYTQPKGPPKVEHPQGWVPGVNTESGEIVALLNVKPRDQLMIDWSELLEMWGFDPDVFTVEDDRVQVRTYTASLGRPDVLGEFVDEQGVRHTKWVRGEPELAQMWYYKANVVRRWVEGDVSDLVSWVRRFKPRKPATVDGESWLLTFWADTQFGKRDEGGTAKAAQAVLDTIGLVQDEQRRVKASRLAIFGMGDLVEGCDGFYPNQAFTVELNRREQVNVATGLFTKVHVELADRFSSVLSAAVGGNHGENRKDGRMFTDLSDNDDLLVWDNIKRVLEANPDRFGHVEVVVPRDSLWLQFQVGASKLSVTHGHVGSARSTSAKMPYGKVWDWWSNHIVANTAGLADSDVLVAAHYHHRFMHTFSGRTLVGCPPLESGSTWYKNAFGGASGQGMLVAVADSSGIHSWKELKP